MLAQCYRRCCRGSTFSQSSQKVSSWIALVLEIGLRRFLVLQLFDGVSVSNDNTLPSHFTLETRRSSPSLSSEAATRKPRAVLAIVKSMGLTASAYRHVPISQSDMFLFVVRINHQSGWFLGGGSDGRGVATFWPVCGSLFEPQPGLSGSGLHPFRGFGSFPWIFLSPCPRLSQIIDAARECRTSAARVFPTNSRTWCQLYLHEPTEPMGCFPDLACSGTSLERNSGRRDRIPWLSRAGVFASRRIRGDLPRHGALAGRKEWLRGSVALP